MLFISCLHQSLLITRCFNTIFHQNISYFQISLRWSLSNKNLFVQKRLKGHSHWQNVKGTKLAEAKKRSTLFNSLIKKIRTAVKDGNGQTNLEFNRKLADAVRLCKQSDMPAELINRSIEKAKVFVKDELVEIAGPSGSYFIIEVSSESLRAAKVLVKRVIAKLGSFYFADSSIQHYFAKKGVIQVAQKAAALGLGIDVLPPSAENGTMLKENDVEPPNSITLSDAENLAIELSAEDVYETTVTLSDGNEAIAFEFICDVLLMPSLLSALQSRGYSILLAESQWIALSKVQLTDDEIQLVQELHARLGEESDVNKIYDNVE